MANADESPLKVFYSWQSDVDAKTTRNLHRDALERALEALGRDPEVEFAARIDEATTDTVGAVDISSKIFEKIAHAAAFVADVTIINPGAARPAPNPNVLLELGYAAAVLGWERVVPVCNTANGPLEALPFDLRGRRVIPYALAEGAADRATVRAKLVAGFTAALRPMLEAAATGAATPGRARIDRHVATSWRRALEQFLWALDALTLRHASAEPVAAARATLTALRNGQPYDRVALELGAVRGVVWALVAGPFTPGDSPVDRAARAIADLEGEATALVRHYGSEVIPDLTTQIERTRVAATRAPAELKGLVSSGTFVRAMSGAIREPSSGGHLLSTLLAQVAEGLALCRTLAPEGGTARP